MLRPIPLAVVCLVALLVRPALADRPPSFVVIFCDDLGYGDLGAFGHPTIRTPRLDRMAAEGQKWTSFYTGASVCTPSRAALLTGRLPIRSGMCSGKTRVLFPDSKGGLPQDEVTIAEALKPLGYATAAVGKWHLGHLPEFLPTRQGFDSYFGIPYSNDMDRTADSPPSREANLTPKIEYFNVPLLRDETVVERPADQSTVTRRYTEEAVRFIEKEKDRPFFLYLAHTMPHVPLFRSEAFAGKSLRGVYGDVVEEIDWSVGEVLDAIERSGIARRTLVVFTSDNGPWLIFDRHGGSAGLLRGGKGGTFEGGMRVPTIFWGPGIVKPGVVAEMGATMDLLPTFCALAGVPLPEGRVLDGFDLGPVLRGAGRSPRETVFYYRGTEVYAVRHGSWKAHFITQPEYGPGGPARHDPPLLHHLEHDPSEKVDVAASQPAAIARIREILQRHLETVTPVPNQLERR